MAFQSLEEGFEKFVIKNPEGCWGWTGCAANPGYGQFRGNQKLIRAHRASWIIHFGEIPKGMYVCHKCDNKLCSNPEHLFLGTCKDNNLDMLKKGRSPILGKSGSSNPSAKLKESQVQEIRLLLKTNMSQREIGAMFSISQTAVSVINTKRYWR